MTPESLARLGLRCNDQVALAHGDGPLGLCRYVECDGLRIAVIYPPGSRIMEYKIGEVEVWPVADARGLRNGDLIRPVGATDAAGYVAGINGDELLVFGDQFDMDVPERARRYPISTRFAVIARADDFDPDKVVS